MSRNGRSWRGVAILLVVLSLVAVGAHPPTGAAIGEPAPVNLDLVLDASGSMAEVLPDGVTRIDTARVVLGDLITSLPDDPALSVGLRVFGQSGTNDEAGRVESCGSTELVVPVDGVDRRALQEAVDAWQPVGWTPVALALDSAGTDFGGGTGATNGIILVTDGEETCDGDPCAVAAELGASDAAIRVDVIGFGTTRAQDDALACIAERSGGETFGADDADELSEALGEILAARRIATPAPEVLFDDGFLADCAAAAADLDAIHAPETDARTVGTDGDDIIIGSDGDDEIDSGAGDDLICAGRGDDAIDTGPGDDIVVGGFGEDTIAGGDGADALGGGADSDLIDGGPGADLVFGGDGDDTIAGGDGDDGLDAYPGEDTVSGDGGDDDRCAAGPGQVLTGCETEIDRGDLRAEYEAG